jgi:small conductance mechanosensitive channel
MVVAGSFLCLPRVAGAATAVPPQGGEALAGVSAASLEKLKATLQDPARRQTLVDQIDGLIQLQGRGEKAAPPDTPSEKIIAAVATTEQDTRAALVLLAGYLGDLPRLGGWLHDLLVDPSSRAAALGKLLEMLLILAPAVIVGLTLRRLLRGTARALDARPSDRMAAKIPLVLLRTLLEIVPVAAVAVTAYVLAPALATDPRAGLLALSLADAYVLIRVVLILAHRLLAPGAPGLRLLPLGDEAALVTYRWVRRISLTAIVGYFVIEIAHLMGMPSLNLLPLRLLGLVLTVLAILFILRIRSRVARAIRDGHAPLLPEGALAQQLRNVAAVLWHVVAIAYVLLIFVVIGWEVEDGAAYLLRGTLGSILVLAIASALMAWLDRVVRRNVRATTGDLAHLPQARERLRGYARLLVQFFRVLVVLGAALGILYLWGVDTPGWLALPAARFVLRVLVTAGVGCLVGVVVWEMVSAAVERALRARDGEETATARSARLHTVLPLLRKVVLVVLGAMVVLMVLAEAGVDIAPLIAGAGVVGIAVGFGAQSLVQDIITGIFILVEDAISVGDVVNVAGIGGVVEDISIRTMRLRDLEGSVHTIPFSSVSTVTNMTKTFSYFVASIGVAYREDTDAVLEVCRGIVDEMREEPRFRRSILQPLEVLGLDQFTEAGVILKARIKTRPIKQWEVGREFNRRMKKRFDEQGIAIALPRVTLYFGEDKQGRAPAGRVRIETDESVKSPGTLATVHGAAGPGLEVG